MIQTMTGDMAGGIAEALAWLAGLAVIGGGAFCFLAALGILRLPDLYARMHAASKAGTVGAGMIFLSVALIATDSSVILRCVAGIGFLILTTPVSAHLLARAAFLASGRTGPPASEDRLDEVLKPVS